MAKKSPKSFAGSRRTSSSSVRPPANALGFSTTRSSKVEAGEAQFGIFFDDYDATTQAVVRTILEGTRISLRRYRSSGRQPVNLIIREVAERLLADNMGTGASQETVDQGWQQLLEEGLKSKTTLLKSREFKSTAEASNLLGIGEPAIRKRVREQKLFALQMPGDGEHRIPAWALDPQLAGDATRTLHEDAGAADEWQLYHFMATPNGSLNGLRPFECLLSSENLPKATLAAREELFPVFKLAATDSLLPVVERVLKADFERR